MNNLGSTKWEMISWKRKDAIFSDLSCLEHQKKKKKNVTPNNVFKQLAFIDFDATLSLRTRIKVLALLLRRVYLSFFPSEFSYHVN